MKPESDSQSESDHLQSPSKSLDEFPIEHLEFLGGLVGMIEEHVVGEPAVDKQEWASLDPGMQMARLDERLATLETELRDDEADEEERSSRSPHRFGYLWDRVETRQAWGYD